MPLKCSFCFAISGFVALCTFASPLRAQTIYNISINTMGINNAHGGLAFDLISGDNAAHNNTVTISDFATNGTLVGSGDTNQGDASGDLPSTVTLQDTAFTEVFRGESFGTILSFTLASTTNFAAPGSPDEFSFFLTSRTNTGSLVNTSDPTGADALFVLDLDGTQTGHLTVFAPLTTGVSYTVTSAQQNVPEPGVLPLIVTSLSAGGILAHHRRLIRTTY